jgi:hypothetical protein
MSPAESPAIDYKAPSCPCRRSTRCTGGRITHRLRRVEGALRMSGKKVVLVNAAEPLPPDLMPALRRIRRPALTGHRRTTTLTS